MAVREVSYRAAAVRSRRWQADGAEDRQQLTAQTHSIRFWYVVSSKGLSLALTKPLSAHHNHALSHTHNG
jgi:hypothetical protein